MSAEIARRVVEAFHNRPANPAEIVNLTKRETGILELITEGLAIRDRPQQVANSPPSEHLTSCESKGG